MKPKPVTQLEIVWGGSSNKFLPPWNKIPEEFKSSTHPWCMEFSRIFFHGGSVEHWKTKPGIDRGMALDHFKAAAASFGPKHEHKEAGLAYLLDQWFTLEPAKSKDEPQDVNP